MTIIVFFTNIHTTERLIDRLTFPLYLCVWCAYKRIRLSMPYNYYNFINISTARLPYPAVDTPSVSHRRVFFFLFKIPQPW